MDIPKEAEVTEDRIAPEDIALCETPGQLLNHPKFDQFLRIFNEYRRKHPDHDYCEYTKEMLIGDVGKANKALQFFRTLPCRNPLSADEFANVLLLAEETVRRIGERLHLQEEGKLKKQEASRLRKKVETLVAESADSTAKAEKVLNIEFTWRLVSQILRLKSIK